MAKLQQSKVVLRFRLGHGLVKARQRWENTSRSILENIAVSYADNEYDQLRKTLEQQVENDIRAELIHLAYLYRRNIIGAAGTRGSPSGTLDTVTKGANAPIMSLSSGLPPWAPRNAEYLRQKRQATGGIAWFDNRGWRSGSFDARYASRVPRISHGPADTGLLFASMRPDVWETMFGPISVRFLRNRDSHAIGSNGLILTGTGPTMRLQVGTIYVRALGKIDLGSMLPGWGLKGGNGYAPGYGNPALMSVVGQYDPRLAYRLGTMRNGIYRPTLEPFLGFFLTRALPHAVSERIRKSTLGSIIRS